MDIRMSSTTIMAVTFAIKRLTFIRIQRNTKNNILLHRKHSFLIHVHQNIVSEIILADTTAPRSIIGCWHDTVICLSVCLSVTKSIVAE